MQQFSLLKSLIHHNQQHLKTLGEFFNTSEMETFCDIIEYHRAKMLTDVYVEAAKIVCHFKEARLDAACTADDVMLIRRLLEKNKQDLLAA